MYLLKFQEEGHSIRAARSAEEAFAFLESDEHFDIVVLDLVMPGTDGFEFLAAAREKGLLKDIPVIVLTNQSREQDIEKARALGARGYVVKASSIPSEVVKITAETQSGLSEMIIKR
jgi:two-component system chemotaxis sensor kinase CheA